MSKVDALRDAPSYFQRYIKYVPGGDIRELLGSDIELMIDFYKKIPENRIDYRYAEGKWNVREILSHIIDTERVMSYRALVFSRDDSSSLSGFNQDQYVIKSRANERSMEDYLAEFESLRRATYYLFKSFDEKMLEKKGSWEGKEASVEALGYIVLGHELHHRRLISDLILELL